MENQKKLNSLEIMQGILAVLTFLDMAVLACYAVYLISPFGPPLGILDPGAHPSIIGWAFGILVVLIFLGFILPTPEVDKQDSTP